MILHPGIIALLIGTALVLAMVIHAAVIGGLILRRWDFTSSSAGQLGLERKTYLVSTLLNYALAFQILSTFLFIYTLDDVHPLFSGAMCATGSLNANPVGWYALLVKIAVFFLAGLWIVLNMIDQMVEDYPLIKLKYTLLIGLLPFIVLDFFFQFSYFTGLDPEIITSCCGSLFGGGGGNVASSLATLPVGKTMVVFYTLALFFIAMMLLCLFSKKPLFRSILSITAAAFLIMAIIAVLSFVSIYIYELPTHHCPFDMVQQEYGFIGYPLYLSLFCGVFFGVLPGIFQPAKRIQNVVAPLDRIEKKWLLSSLGFTLFFILLVSWQVIFSNLKSFSVSVSPGLVSCQVCNDLRPGRSGASPRGAAPALIAFKCQFICDVRPGCSWLSGKYS